MVYLTTLSGAQTIHCQIVGWLVNNGLEGMWNRVVLALFEVLACHLPGGAEKN
jgi:hypothetical protein